MRAAWIAVACVAACTVGAPHSFSGGDGERFTFPLVGSLEGGTLFVPVMVGDRGPYLFAIDPDTHHTVLGARVIVEGKLRTATPTTTRNWQPGMPGAVSRDERGREHRTLLVEVPIIRMGDLVVTRQVFRGIKVGAFDRRGRRVDGVIGRDLLRDTLVFVVDRDRALGVLATVTAYRPPANAQELRYTPQRFFQRHLVTASIFGVEASVHLDLGSEVSQLVESKWDAAKLVSEPIAGAVTNEFGVTDPVSKLTRPTAVRVGKLVAPVSFIPYVDKIGDASGALGLDFFEPFDVALHWEKSAYYVSPRSPETYTTRVARWPTLARCSNPGCVTLRLDQGVLEIEREHVAVGTNLEVVLAVDDKPGPQLVINLPPHADRVRGNVAASAVTVIDASPFPRACPGGQGCIDTLAR